MEDKETAVCKDTRLEVGVFSMSFVLCKEMAQTDQHPRRRASHVSKSTLYSVVVSRFSCFEFPLPSLLLLVLL